MGTGRPAAGAKRDRPFGRVRDRIAYSAVYRAALSGAARRLRREKDEAVDRRLSRLAETEHDLVVVGGGISGLCAAWDAALRGLSVALLERRDFAHGASANCFKVVHGGIRYLQHADLLRTRQSSAERRALLRVAPHQVSPLPILVPTYGHGAKGKELLAAGLKAYDAVTWDRNRGLRDRERRVPATRLLSRAAVRATLPELDAPGLTGGALFHDAQMYSPARLALCFLLAAAERGVRAANHVEVTRLLRRGPRVCGVVARDTLEDRELEVRGRVVLNATGGWAPGLLERSARGGRLDPRPTFSRDAYFVVRRRIGAGCGIAVPGRTRDPDALLSRSARHLFLMPWRDCTLVGVWHRVWEEEPERAQVSEGELRDYLDEVNASLPGLELRREEVALVHCGLVLFGDNAPGAEHLRYGHRSRIVDHAKAGGAPGLVTLLGVRYTTARRDAARAIDRVCDQLGRRVPPPPTATRPVYGGAIESVSALAREAARAHPELAPEVREALLRNHGAEYERVLAIGRAEPGSLVPLPGTTTLRAEVLHAVRSEMARKLADLVFHRTDLGTAGSPGRAALEVAAELMAGELDWEPARRAKEVEEVLSVYPAAPGEPSAP